MSNNLYEGLNNLYSVSKTLKFELKPVGKTDYWIKEKGLLEKDEQRAKDYKLAKEIIDRFHKNFIEECLSEVDSLDFLEYIKALKEKNDKKLNNIEEQLRKDIIKLFKKNPKYKYLDKKEMFKKDELLLKICDTQEECNIVNNFNKFTTYFTGFNTNRMNMYSEEEKSTSIAYRLINENLPRFIENIKVFEKVYSEIDLYSEIEKIVTELSDFYDDKLVNVFSIDYYKNVLSQNQIDKYNKLIGGYSSTFDDKIKGLNEYINEYNQKKNTKIPKFKTLYKMILSEGTSDLSFKLSSMENDNELIDSINTFIDIDNNKNNIFKTIDDQIELLKNISKYDLSKIFVSKKDVSTISQEIYDNWSIIQTDKNSKSYSLSQINHIAKENLDSEDKYIDCINYFYSKKFKDCRNKIDEKYKNISDLLNEKFDNNKVILSNNKKYKNIIKDFLDSIKEWQSYLRILVYSGNEEKDLEFYSEYERLYERLYQIIPLYNKVRNYLTKKPYSIEKIKLNFENAQLLKGWDLNKEKDNTCTLFIHNNKYYLGIIDKNNKNIFDKYDDKNYNSNDFYQKMQYKLLPGPNKMLPKVFFATSNEKIFNPPSNILQIRKKESFKKGDNFNIDDCREFIDFFKCSIERHDDWKNFKFNFSDTKNYHDISEFYREVEKQGYKIKFINIATEYIDELVEEGKLYLFQIYNKDFSVHSKGTKNLHTLYWEMLFNKENLKNPIYKLNGEAEIFHRKPSIERKITHPANQPIKRKQINDGKESLFKYDLVKNKRFTEEKYLFHVPITINFNNKSITGKAIDNIVNHNIYNSDEYCIIGLDRGERNLIDYSVINQDGKIIEQGSLNVIKDENKGYEVDYLVSLTKRENERKKEKQSWDSITNIKDLKEGYLSQAIHKLCKLMLKYNALIAMEDLNVGFKHSREKFERQVYQKFEKMLIDKTNLLIDKTNKDIHSTAGLLKAYQLSKNFESFKKIGKQSGIIFYVPAALTSKIDPSTGFVNYFYSNWTAYKSIKQSKEFFSQFKDIRYNNKEKYFEFVFDYKDFKGTHCVVSKSNWTICTYGKRVKTFRNKNKNNEWDSVEIDLTDEYKKLFAKYELEYMDNLQEIIVSQKNADFYKEVLKLFKLTIQMRNSKSGTDIDYIQSPVKNKDGVFFNSQEVYNNSYPIDADANGAYHIAKKCLMLTKIIKERDEDEIDKIKLFDIYKRQISSDQWVKFAQDNC